jgi:hypothetical protein
MSIRRRWTATCDAEGCEACVPLIGDQFDGKWELGLQISQGNPHTVRDVGRAEAVRLFEDDLRAGRLAVSVDDGRHHLAGRPLGCHCRLDEACHAEVLLRVANSELGED